MSQPMSTTGQPFLIIPGGGDTTSSHRALIDRKRLVIPGTCTLHGGAWGFTNIAASKQQGGLIEIDPHVAGACVVTFELEAATELRDALTRWLG